MGMGVWNGLFQEDLSRLRVTVSAGSPYREGRVAFLAGSAAATSTLMLLAVVPGVFADMQLRLYVVADLKQREGPSRIFVHVKSQPLKLVTRCAGNCFGSVRNGKSRWTAAGGCNLFMTHQPPRGDLIVGLEAVQVHAVGPRGRA